jgi:hypothetical protein
MENMTKDLFISDVNETLARMLAEAQVNRNKRISLLSFDYSLFRKDRDFVGSEEESKLPDFVRWTLEAVREQGYTCRVENDTAQLTQAGHVVGSARQWTVFVNVR